MKRLSTGRRWALAFVLSLVAGATSLKLLSHESQRAIPNFSGEIEVTFRSDAALANNRTVEPYQLKIARTNRERQQGLMFVQSEHLRGRRGMIFVFDDEKIQRFWMKDTPSELDMIFVDTRGRVVGIIERVPPYTTTIRSVDRPSRYVIEILGGGVAADKIKVGDRISCESSMFGIPCNGA